MSFVRSLAGRVRRLSDARRPVLSVLDRNGPATDAGAYTQLADALDDHFDRDFLSHWFPRAVNETIGGFSQDFGPDWGPTPPTERLVVHQARQTWLCSRAALHYPDRAPQFCEYARHGLDYLRGPMSDDEFDGPFFSLTDSGRPETFRGTEKSTYASMFVILAAVAVHEATGDAQARDFAVQVFEWVDRCAHDDDHEGYFEALDRDGTPILKAPDRSRRDAIGTPYGCKSANTHIHVLETLVDLYRIAPRPHLRNRIVELLRVVRERLIAAPGAMHFYYTLDWRPLPMHDSFGHNIEAACFMLNAAAALDEHENARTVSVARSLVDHALECGWDVKNGGFWYAGQAVGPPFDRRKSWWVQAEGMHSLFRMHETFHRETDRYWVAFRKQLQFIFRHIVDRRHGGWRSWVEESGSRPPWPACNKASDWKAGYHDGRALMVTISGLRRLADGA